MLSLPALLIALAMVCFAALKNPGWGVIGFYFFAILDPEWNWRWAVPDDLRFQFIIFLFIIAGLTLNGFKTQRISTVSRKGLIAGVAFLVWCWLSMQTSINATDSVIFMSYLWKILIVAFLAILTVDSHKKLWFLLVAISIAHGYNAYQINLDYLQKGFSTYAYRNWGTGVGDNNGYSLVCLCCLSISISIAVIANKHKTKIFFMFIALMQAHVILLLLSRGAMLASLLIPFIVIWKTPRKSNNFAYYILIAVLGFALIGKSVSDEFATIFTNQSERDSSAESRLTLWKIGIAITRDYPTLGCGPNAARRLVPKYSQGEFNSNQKALHNIFLDVSTGMGIPGLFLFLAFLLNPLVYCIRTLKNCRNPTIYTAKMSVIVGLPVYCIGSLFSSGLLFEASYALLAIGYITSNLDSNAPPPASFTDSTQSRTANPDARLNQNSMQMDHS